MVIVVIGILAVSIVWPSPVRAGELPDPKLTPGVASKLTTAQICDTKTKLDGDVDEDTKQKVYAAYHMNADAEPCPCEIDRLIPLGIGGEPSEIRNLWPQSYETKPWNALVKDELENRLHELVCSGKLGLKAAQQEIAKNWIKSYKRRMGP